MRGSGRAPHRSDGELEVGHLNLGAGRIVYQDLTRIDQAVKDGSLEQNPVPPRSTAPATRALTSRTPLAWGRAQSRAPSRHGPPRSPPVKRIAYTFLDSRDTPPRSAMASIRAAETVLGEAKDRWIATVSGRYHAMDHDKRWDRTEGRALVLGDVRAADSAEAVSIRPTRGESDSSSSRPSCAARTDPSERRHGRRVQLPPRPHAARAPSPIPPSMDFHVPTARRRSLRVHDGIRRDVRFP